MPRIKTINILFLIFCLVWMVQECNGIGGNPTPRFQVGMFSGFRSISCDSFQMNNHLDYVNAIHTQSKYAYVGINLKYTPNQRFSSYLALLFVDSYFFNNINFKMQYFPFRNFGISAGYYSFDYFLENYDKYFRLTYPQYSIYDDDNFFQRRNSDQALIFGPVFRFNSNKLNLVLILNGGLMKNKKFTETFTLKQNNSNLTLQHKIETIRKRSPVFFPELKIHYTFLQLQQCKLGLQIQTSVLLQDKYINYKNTVYRWTNEHPETEIVLSSKHNFLKYEIDAGIVVSW